MVLNLDLIISENWIPTTNIIIYKAVKQDKKLYFFPKILVKINCRKFQQICKKLNNKVVVSLMLFKKNCGRCVRRALFLLCIRNK